MVRLDLTQAQGYFTNYSEWADQLEDQMPTFKSWELIGKTGAVMRKNIEQLRSLYTTLVRALREKNQGKIDPSLHQSMTQCNERIINLEERVLLPKIERCMARCAVGMGIAFLIVSPLYFWSVLGSRP